MDTYSRVFPKTIESFVTEGAWVTTKHGLTLLPTGDAKTAALDELHVLDTSTVPEETFREFGNPEIVTYQDKQEQYIFDYSLARVDQLYGKKYGKIVKLLLDYN